MFAIYKKEIQSFFSSVSGYLVIGLFLIISSLFLFVFPGSYNILDAGFSDLKPFFDLAPWIFLFLIPAITMKIFADEKRTGTLELLLTKPVGIWKLILGKYLAGVFLVKMAIIPSFLYIYTIHELGNPIGNWDLGATLGSYAGLIFLGACYTAIGTFCSSITSNQIVAFLSSVFLCFICYYGFEAISQLNLMGQANYLLNYFGISFHYKSISRGVIDTRDLVYFLSLILLFLKLTQYNLSNEKNLRQ